jgi:hypothetical protein
MTLVDLANGGGLWGCRWRWDKRTQGLMDVKASGAGAENPWLAERIKETQLSGRCIYDDEK